MNASEYENMIKHLPVNHSKNEAACEADARRQVLQLTSQGWRSAFAANQYGTFTVFKW
jgi:hypothetical protein